MATFDIRLRITIGAGIASVAIASAAIYTYSNYPNLRKVLEFSVAAFATAAGITGASYVAQDSGRTAKETKNDRTLSFISRWNDPSFNKKQVIGLLREIRETKPKDIKTFIVDKVNQDNDLKSELTTILNFLAEMSLAIQNNFVDENILRKYFKGILLKYVETFASWIEYRREIELRKQIFHELTSLYDSWKEGNGYAK